MALQENTEKAFLTRHTAVLADARAERRARAAETTRSVQELVDTGFVQEVATQAVLDAFFTNETRDARVSDMGRRARKRADKWLSAPAPEQDPDAMDVDQEAPNAALVAWIDAVQVASATASHVEQDLDDEPPLGLLPAILVPRAFTPIAPRDEFRLIPPVGAEQTARLLFISAAGMTDRWTGYVLDVVFGGACPPRFPYRVTAAVPVDGYGVPVPLSKPSPWLCARHPPPEDEALRRQGALRQGAIPVLFSSRSWATLDAHRLFWRTAPQRTIDRPSPGAASARTGLVGRFFCARSAPVSLGRDVVIVATTIEFSDASSPALRRVGAPPAELYGSVYSTSQTGLGFFGLDGTDDTPGLVADVVATTSVVRRPIAVTRRVFPDAGPGRGEQAITRVYSGVVLPTRLAPVPVGEDAQQMTLCAKLSSSQVDDRLRGRSADRAVPGGAMGSRERERDPDIDGLGVCVCCAAFVRETAAATCDALCIAADGSGW